ncbi:YunG family protein [Allorhizocola rhizosphaerae]|uniref:YunG family protein n=1 Tax=Allorhizocola rhizosphaerae TaxID=1872709 RepID=UPI000E3D16D0|nr:hypothetical protein [Allorhizocola rhizosphaerae]
MPADLVEAIRRSWDEQTCDPVDLPWSPDNPSRGQCGVTALVLHDLLGGDLVVGEVRYASGDRQGWHTWNRLPDGTFVDLTRQQFGPDELVGPGRIVARKAPKRCVEQYELLRSRVLAHLDVVPQF